VSGDEGNQGTLWREERAGLAIREKLIAFADNAGRHPVFAKELPRFLAAVWQVFNQHELAGYIASLKPTKREQLPRLLFVK